eukprot:scaffold20463_cov23-Tisochrysis_lutea.AAC.1
MQRHTPIHTIISQRHRHHPCQSPSQRHRHYPYSHAMILAVQAVLQEVMPFSIYHVCRLGDCSKGGLCVFLRSRPTVPCSHKNFITSPGPGAR